MPVSDEDLHAALTTALDRPVAAVARRPHAYRSSCAIEELEVQLSNPDERLEIVFKDLASTDSKPSFVLDPVREIDVYRTVLGPLGVDAPRYLGSVVDRGWLFLEAVDGELLWQVAGDGVWAAAARWLAELHRRRIVVSPAHLITYDEPWLRQWLPRALAATPHGALDRIATGYDRIVRRLVEWPIAFLHGEFYPSNVLVADGRLRPIDWEMAGVGPGLLDLAALTAGDWSEAQRERIALAYHDAWAPVATSADDLLDALEHARIQVALQWLGWSTTWSPPPEHARDWLADALHSAERLGL